MAKGNLNETENIKTHHLYNMGQKCKGNCDFWVLNKMIKKMYPENLKKVMGAISELPAK